jgi:hypothetical protein
MFTLTSLLRQSAAALALVAASAAPAGAITIVTGSYAASGLGAEFATPYDNFNVDGTTLSLATPVAPVEVTLGDLSFEVGPNCWSCTLTPSFDAFIDVTIDGLTQQLDLLYSWSSSGPNDILSFATPAPLMFDFGSSGLVTVAFEDLTNLTSPGGIVHGNFNAIVTVSPVPEPTNVAMMFAGFGVMAFVARRRRT